MAGGSREFFQLRFLALGRVKNLVKNSIARLINRQPVKWNPFLIGITSDVTDTTSPSPSSSISFSFHREIVVRRASFALAAILLTNYSRIFSHIVSSGKRSRRRRVSKMSSERIYPNVVNAMIVSRDSSRRSRDEKDLRGTDGCIRSCEFVFNGAPL